MVWVGKGFVKDGKGMVRDARGRWGDEMGMVGGWDGMGMVREWDGDGRGMEDDQKLYIFLKSNLSLYSHGTEK